MSLTGRGCRDRCRVEFRTVRRGPRGARRPATEAPSVRVFRPLTGRGWPSRSLVALVAVVAAFAAVAAHLSPPTSTGAKSFVLIFAMRPSGW